jgi:acetyltransferase-like isoleucine patch superfamily enzyme
MPSPARRAIHLLRRGVQEARRLRARADAIEHARRTFSLSDAERLLVLREEARRHVADGTTVMGRRSGHVPIVRKFKGDTGRVFVGDFVSIADDVELYSGGLHRTEWVSQYGLRAMLDLPGAYEDGFPHGRGDVHVGHDASLARGAIVMSGVTIGPGAVVQARALVTKDVEPYEIVGGVPARPIGRRFDGEQIAALLRIAWWDWPIEAIEERVELLSSADADTFIAAYDPGPDGAG